MAPSFVFVWVLLLSSPFTCDWIIAEGAAANAEVKRFPGFDGVLPSKHYAGYISVGSQLYRRHLYYYFITSERDPLKDPVTLWIHGGQTCSGVGSIISGLGPFVINNYTMETIQLQLNPFSWNKVSNIIFLDSPAGTGFSYVESSEDYVTNDTKTVADLYDFIIKWFSEYSEFLQNPFYMFGSSYGGLLLPPVAEKIVNGNEAGHTPTLNFKGYILGNAGADLSIEANSRVQFANHMGLISDELYMELYSSCNGIYWNSTDPVCLRNLESYQQDVAGINDMHILCLPCHFEMRVDMIPDEYDSIRMYHGHQRRLQDSIYCNDYNERPKRLFNLQSSRESIHAAQEEVTGEWMRCTHRNQYNRTISSVISHHLSLTTKGYRAFIFNGDHDFVVTYIATLEWIKMLNYSVIEKWRPWFVKDQIVGYTVRYDHNVLFATFKGAGHFVPDYMPHAALVAYQRWIDGAENL